MKKQAPNEMPDDDLPLLALNEFFDHEEQRPGKRPFQSIVHGTFQDEEVDEWQKAARTSDDDSPSTFLQDADEPRDDSEEAWLQVAAEVDDSLPEIHEATSWSSTTTGSPDDLARIQAEQLHPQALPFAPPWGIHPLPQPHMVTHNVPSPWQSGYRAPFQLQASSAMPPLPMVMPPLPPQQVVDRTSAHHHSTTAPPSMLTPYRTPHYPPQWPPPPAYTYHIHMVPPPTPSPLPMPMYTPTDDDILSDYQVFLRQQIEFFQANVLEVETATPGRKKPISLHQIGIRCKHCSTLPISERKAATAYFPTKLNGLYQAAQNIASTHLAELCPNLSNELREALCSFQSSGKRATAGHGGKQYWADTANAMGIVESPDGLRFARG